MSGTHKNPHGANHHSARTNKGHPRKVARRARALVRLADHVYNPERCKPGCPKRGAA